MAFYRENQAMGYKLSAMIETTKARVRSERESYKFIPTNSFQDAYTKLTRNRVVVIKGNTGDGKTSTGVELVNLLCHNVEDGQQQRQPVELHDIKDLDLVLPRSQLVIYLDDIFGKNVVEEKGVREWKKRENDILSQLCDSEHSQSNFFIITSSSGILSSLKAKDLLQGEVFTEQNIVEININVKERLTLLRSYEPKGHCFVPWTDDEEKEIALCAPDTGFPQCCLLFRDLPSLQAERVNFFRRPFHFMKYCLSRLEDGKCYSLMYLFLNGGIVQEGNLDPKSEKFDKKLLETAFDIDVVKVTPTFEPAYKIERKEEFVKRSLDCLLGWLVKIEPVPNGKYCYEFSHSSIEETLALLYGAKTPIGFMLNCPRKFLNYVTTSDTTPYRIFISSENQFNILYKRFLKEFQLDYYDQQNNGFDEKYQDITTLDVWTDIKFLWGFLQWLRHQNIDKNLYQHINLAILNGACVRGSEECALYLLSEGVKPDSRTPFHVVNGGSMIVLRKLLEYDIIPNARAERSQLSNFVYDINVLHEACLFEREEMVGLLCDTYPHLAQDTVVQSPLHLAALKGNCDIFQKVERTVLKSLHRAKDKQLACESVDGRMVHRNCVCAHYMSDLVDQCNWGETVLHISCFWGHKNLCFYLCESYPALVTVVDQLRRTVLHLSCRWGHREICVYLCQMFPALTTVVDKDGRHCLHLIARFMSDVHVFLECEAHVRQYLESLGQKYDITTILDRKGRSVLDKAKERVQYRMAESNPLYDHLLQVFSQ